jgi:hypothetical protein
MSTKKTQKEKILTWLKSGKTLTQLQALKRFQCQALSSRINNLRDDGHKIHTEMIETVTGKWVAQYSL